MCEIFSDGYKLKNGKLLKITDVHPDELPEYVRKELEQSPASQLEMLYLRTNMHRNAKNIDSIASDIATITEALKGMSEKFDKQLSVEVTNGKTELRPITELIAELWERDQDRRDASSLSRILKKHKKKIFFLLALFLFFNVFFKEHVHQMVDWIANNVLNILKWLF